MIQAQTAGELLRIARERSGRDLVSFAQETCIRSGILRAIEADDHAELPARPFAVGFVRSYADALGLDPEPVVARFKRQLDGVSAMPVLPPAPRARSFGRRITGLAGSIAALMGLAAPVAGTADHIAPILDEAQL